MSFRLQLKGYRCRYVPSAVVRHIGSGTISEHGRLVARETVKNSVFTVLTCAPSEYLRRYWPKMMRFHLALWWTLARRGHAGAVMSGWIWLVCHTVPLAIQRRRLQRRRAVEFAALDDLLYKGPVHLNLPQEVVTFE
jgi:GT2 family glycosyltransferase